MSIFVDGENPSFICALKERLDKDSNYEQQISFLKKSYPYVYDMDLLARNRFVILVPFAKYYKEMLVHCKFCKTIKKSIHKKKMRDIKWKETRPLDLSLNVEKATKILNFRPNIFDLELVEFSNERPFSAYGS